MKLTVKQSIALVFFLILSVSVVGCNGDSGSKKSDPDPRISADIDTILRQWQHSLRPYTKRLIRPREWRDVDREIYSYLLRLQSYKKSDFSTDQWANTKKLAGATYDLGDYIYTDSKFKFNADIRDVYTVIRSIE